MTTASGAALRADRFELAPGQASMKAVVTTGNGGYEKLVYGDVPIPAPGPGEALLQVLAAGVNNVEINTRLGWYSHSVVTDTAQAARAAEVAAPAPADGGWDAPTPFPLIQGTDCCGRVVAVGGGGSERLVGQRVLVRPCVRPRGFQAMDNVWLGADFDGAFAQFVKVPLTEVFPVRCSWSDAELGSIPCAYGTAENMLQRARLRRGEHVLISGASGGVGSAALQLARRRGATVIAIAAREKMARVRALGADQVIERAADVVASLAGRSVDVVVDNVGGPSFPGLLHSLRRGGRYVSSGAIGGPLVTLDMRSFYLRDLTLIGCTAWDEPVFPDLIACIERGEIRPLVAAIYPLERIADAQREFMRKQHVGNLVLIPPPVAPG
jgi:NADPH:quinone reductase-like Zn-dependent oxidoreductase